LTQIKARAPGAADDGERLEASSMQRFLPVLLLLFAATPATGEGAGDFLRDADAGLDLRYRLENVEQDGMTETADASTLRFRLNLTSGAAGGFSGMVQLDHVEALGSEQYNDTRNGKVEFPVVPDPEGTDLNQLWLQYRGARETLLRLGRQTIALDDERFISLVGWRQNEQSFDALRLETQALPRTTFTYAYVENVRRAVGPDSGIPPAELDSDSHLVNARIDALPVGVLTVFGYLLDFGNAPQLSSNTYGARYEGDYPTEGGLKLGWSLGFAMQQDAGGNLADIDADYSLIELRVDGAWTGLVAGRAVLSGESGVFAADASPAFQTPLATPHKWQGWADKFATTPSTGIVDVYLGVSAKLTGWKGQAIWHEFGAEATDADYGTELDLVVSRRFADRYEFLAKYADYSARELFTSTRKFWIQLSADF
jgi:hypothetical protein